MRATVRPLDAVAIPPGTKQRLLNRILGTRQGAEHAVILDQQAAMTLDALFAEVRPRVHACKLCHNCDTKPVFTAKTDFFDDVRLLILCNLLKVLECRKFPAYMARPLILKPLQRFGIHCETSARSRA